jgi:hypothetical protein
MTIPKTAVKAVTELRQQNFFQNMQDPSLSLVDKQGMQADKMKQFLETELSTVGGSQVAAGWGEHLLAELRSGGAPLQEILQELKMLRTVDRKIGEMGLHKTQQEYGYVPEGQNHEHKNGHKPVQWQAQGGEAVTMAEVRPDAITPETQGAYDKVQADKAKGTVLET